MEAINCLIQPLTEATEHMKAFDNTLLTADLETINKQWADVSHVSVISLEISGIYRKLYVASYTFYRSNILYSCYWD